MNTSILGRSVRLLLPPLVLLSVHLFLRGHHEPGGGFIAGLMLSSVVVLVALVAGTQAARAVLPVTPVSLLALGLLVACASTVPALLVGLPPLTGMWMSLGSVHLGTPLVFDLGVMFLVVGAACAFVLHFLEAEDQALEQGK